MPQGVRNFALRYFKEQLKASPKALEYLKYRGLSDKAIDFFNIGYDDGNLLNNLKGKGFMTGTIAESGLAYCDDRGIPQSDFFRNRIVFQSTMLGNMIYATGRDLSGNSSRKYLNIPGPQTIFINEEILLTKPKYVILAEGYMDCYSLVMNKFPSVAVAGCNRAKKSLLEKLLKIPEIYIMFDNELNQSGQKGAIKTAYNLSQLGHKCVRIATIPRLGQDKMDINDLCLQMKSKFSDTIKDVLIASSKPFHTLPLYSKMIEEEMAKPIMVWDVSAELSMQTYRKYMDVKSISAKLSRACCPFHRETKPSFTIYHNKGYSLCYGCGLKFDNGIEFENLLLERRRMEIK